MINFLIPNIMADSKFHNPFVVSKTQIKVCSSISLIDVVIQNLGKILRASCDPICAGYKLPILAFQDMRHLLFRNVASDSSADRSETGFEFKIAQKSFRRFPGTCLFQFFQLIGSLS